MTRLDKFSLLTGIVGLFADTIAIGSFATSIGLFAIPNPAVQGSTNGTLLITGIIGFYSLALIIWFLVRLERARKPAAMDELHELLEIEGEDSFGILIVFIPLIGAFLLASYRSMRIIFFLAIFIAFLPVTIWLYTLTAESWIACGLGIIVSALLSQYSSFFAIVLDKFFK